MKSLIAQLTEQTQDLKAEFIANTKKWATAYFAVIEERNGWGEIEWCNFLGLKPEMRTAWDGKVRLTYPANFYNTKAARIKDNEQTKIRRIMTLGLDSFVAKEIKESEDHYTSSIEKLALRLNKKGVTDGSSFTISKARVGVNLEITISHDGKVTKAWTIVAQGDIQRPHYRYLVK